MKTFSLLALALVASLGIVPAASAQTTQDGASGGMSLTVHTHSSQFGGPGGSGTMVATDPIDFPREQREGSFSYSSISCATPAPFNDRALNFNPDYPGIKDPAPVRHVVEGTITEFSGRTGTAEGTITTFLCEDGEETDQIITSFEGRVRETSDNQMRFIGTYEITGGTGRFSDLSGMGSMTGEFTCLPKILEREDAASCAELGVFSDAIFRLKGQYSDPTAPA